MVVPRAAARCSAKVLQREWVVAEGVGERRWVRVWVGLRDARAITVVSKAARPQGPMSRGFADEQVAHSSNNGCCRTALCSAASDSGSSGQGSPVVCQLALAVGRHPGRVLLHQALDPNSGVVSCTGSTCKAKAIRLRSKAGQEGCSRQAPTCPCLCLATRLPINAHTHTQMPTLPTSTHPQSPLRAAWPRAWPWHPWSQTGRR